MTHYVVISSSLTEAFRRRDTAVAARFLAFESIFIPVATSVPEAGAVAVVHVVVPLN
jgi:hypothetical protein